LIGSGPFTTQYINKIDERRLTRLCKEEKHLFTETLKALETADGNKDPLMTLLGQMVHKTDNYDLVDYDISGTDLPTDGLMYNRIWSEAARLRKDGTLYKSLFKIKCPVTVMHGEFDPHPVEGVTEPLIEVGLQPEIHIFSKCGHEPFKERYAVNEFYNILNEIFIKHI